MLISYFYSLQIHIVQLHTCGMQLLMPILRIRSVGYTNHFFLRVNSFFQDPHSAVAHAWNAAAHATDPSHLGYPQQSHS